MRDFLHLGAIGGLFGIPIVIDEDMPPGEVRLETLAGRSVTVTGLLTDAELAALSGGITGEDEFGDASVAAELAEDRRDFEHEMREALAGSDLLNRMRILPSGSEKAVAQTDEEVSRAFEGLRDELDNAKLRMKNAETREAALVGRVERLERAKVALREVLATFVSDNAMGDGWSRSVYVSDLDLDGWRRAL